MLDSFEYRDLTIIRTEPTSIVAMCGDDVVQILDFATTAECDERWGAIAVSICQETT